MTISSFSKINDLGKSRTPFLFLISYNKKDIRIFPLPVDPLKLKFNFPNQRNSRNRKLSSELIFNVSKPNHEQYKVQFEQTQQSIQEGKISQLNLTRATPVQCNHSLESIYKAAKAPYKLWIHDEFVVFSPETFIKIEAGVIHTFPMKGTIDAATPHAKQQILLNPKEIDEHGKVVKMVLEDMSKVAGNVHVERYRYANKIKSKMRDIWQISSHIRGTLPNNWQDNLGDLLNKILPGGSIAGVPRENALQVISEVEDYERGFYTGIMGVFDGEKLDSAVMIRFIEQTSNGFVYKSGGGITAQSDCQKEHNELIEKIYVPIH